MKKVTITFTVPDELQVDSCVSNLGSTVDEFRRNVELFYEEGLTELTVTMEQT